MLPPGFASQIILGDGFRRPLLFIAKKVERLAAACQYGRRLSGPPRRIAPAGRGDLGLVSNVSYGAIFDVSSRFAATISRT
jgi:hypothetical protein